MQHVTKDEDGKQNTTINSNYIILYYVKLNGLSIKHHQYTIIVK